MDVMDRIASYMTTPATERAEKTAIVRRAMLSLDDHHSKYSNGLVAGTGLPHGANGFAHKDALEDETGSKLDFSSFLEEGDFVTKLELFLPIHAVEHSDSQTEFAGLKKETLQTLIDLNTFGSADSDPFQRDFKFRNNPSKVGVLQELNARGLGFHGDRFKLASGLQDSRGYPSSGENTAAGSGPTVVTHGSPDSSLVAGYLGLNGEGRGESNFWNRRRLVYRLIKSEEYDEDGSIVPVSKAETRMKKTSEGWEAATPKEMAEGIRDSRVFDFKDLVTSEVHIQRGHGREAAELNRDLKESSLKQKFVAVANVQGSSFSTLAYGAKGSTGKWQPEYDADYILGHDENGVVKRFLRDSIVPHRWAGDTVFPPGSPEQAQGSTLRTGQVFPMITESDKKYFQEIMSTKVVSNDNPFVTLGEAGMNTNQAGEFRMWNEHKLQWVGEGTPRWPLDVGKKRYLDKFFL